MTTEPDAITTDESSTTSTAEATTSTTEATTSTAEATTTSTTQPTTTSTTQPTTTSTTQPTTTSTTQPTTTSTTQPTTTTTQPTTTSTTQPTTTTTQPTTTSTTQPTTTSTTQPTTTTTQPTTTTTEPTTTSTTQPTTTTTEPPGSTCASNGQFESVFRDDFSGSSLSGQWSPYYSEGNHGYGLRRPSAIAVQNGRLVMTAQMIDGSLVSGGMSHNYTQQYGKYRFRIRTDNDSSLALSGVALTWPASGVHPRDGENNIYETLVERGARNPFYTFIHEPYGSVHDQTRFVHNADGSQFQIMTMEWTPDYIMISREGPGGATTFEQFTLNESSQDVIPDNPHRFTLQLDAWKHTTTNVVRMEVDWVEIYRYCG